MSVAQHMCWRELGADGRRDDGVRREDAVQPAEDDRLHTVAAALVTLRRDLDSKGGGWVGPPALHAASSSNQGSGWAPSGPAAPWENRTAQSRQAPLRRRGVPSLGTAEGGVLTLRRYSGRVRRLACLGVALLVCIARRGEVAPVEQVLAQVGGRGHICTALCRELQPGQPTQGGLLTLTVVIPHRDCRG